MSIMKDNIIKLAQISFENAPINAPWDYTDIESGTYTIKTIGSSKVLLDDKKENYYRIFNSNPSFDSDTSIEPFNQFMKGLDDDQECELTVTNGTEETVHSEYVTALINRESNIAEEKKLEEKQRVSQLSTVEKEKLEELHVKNPQDASLIMDNISTLGYFSISIDTFSKLDHG